MHFPIAGRHPSCGPESSEPAGKAAIQTSRNPCFAFQPKHQAKPGRPSLSLVISTLPPSIFARSPDSNSRLEPPRPRAYPNAEQNETTCSPFLSAAIPSSSEHLCGCLVVRNLRNLLPHSLWSAPASQFLRNQSTAIFVTRGPRRSQANLNHRHELSLFTTTSSHPSRLACRRLHLLGRNRVCESHPADFVVPVRPNWNKESASCDTLNQHPRGH